MMPQQPPPVQQRGPMENRPPAQTVPPGWRYVVEDDHGERAFVSDGTDWVPDQADELWTLKYGEDVRAGDLIRNCYRLGEDHVQAGPVTVVRSEGVEVTEFVEVLEARSFPEAGLVSCRTLRPNGEQVPLYLRPGELVRVRQDLPT